MENNQASVNKESLETAPDLEITKQGLSPFKTLFKESWHFFKSNFKQIFYFFFFLTFIPSFTQILLQFFGLKLISSLQSTVSMMIIWGLFGIIAFVVSLVFQIINIGAIKKINEVSSGVNERTMDSYKKILKFSFPLIWTSAIVIAMIVGGTFAFVVPGILFAISAHFVTALVVIENKKGLDAIVSSFWYVQGRRWGVFWRMILSALVIVGVGILLFVILASVAIGLSYLFLGGIEVPIAYVTKFMILNSGSDYSLPTNLFYLFSALWTVPVSAITAVFWGVLNVFIFKLWQNLKITKTDSIPADFDKKTKRQIKFFAWIGVVCIITLIIASIVSSQMEQPPVSVPAETVNDSI